MLVMGEARRSWFALLVLDFKANSMSKLAGEAPAAD